LPARSPAACALWSPRPVRASISLSVSVSVCLCVYLHLCKCCCVQRALEQPKCFTVCRLRPVPPPLGQDAPRRHLWQPRGRRCVCSRFVCGCSCVCTTLSGRGPSAPSTAVRLTDRCAEEASLKFAENGAVISHLDVREITPVDASMGDLLVRSVQVSRRPADHALECCKLGRALRLSKEPSLRNVCPSCLPSR
jgi:hypothetical protein